MPPKLWALHSLYGSLGYRQEGGLQILWRCSQSKQKSLQIIFIASVSSANLELPRSMKFYCEQQSTFLTSICKKYNFWAISIRVSNSYTAQDLCYNKLLPSKNLLQIPCVHKARQGCKPKSLLTLSDTNAFEYLRRPQVLTSCFGRKLSILLDTGATLLVYIWLVLTSAWRAIQY